MSSSKWDSVGEKNGIMCIVLHKGGSAGGHFSLSPVMDLPMIGGNQVVGYQIPSFCLFLSIKTSAQAVNKIGKCKTALNTINLMVLDLVLMHLVIHSYDTESFLIKYSFSLCITELECIYFTCYMYWNLVVLREKRPNF